VTDKKLKSSTKFSGSFVKNIYSLARLNPMWGTPKAVLAIESDVVTPNFQFKKAKKGMVGIGERETYTSEEEDVSRSRRWD
jgi:hypothetical protein